MIGDPPSAHRAHWCKNEPLGPNTARYSSRTLRKLFIYMSSLYFQCILLQERIEAPLCPDFYGHPSCNLSAGNARETCAVLAGTKTNHSGLTSLEMALGRNGKYIYMYLGYVCNVVYGKKRIEGMLRPVFYLPIPAGRSRSPNRYPPPNARRARRNGKRAAGA